MLKRIIKKKIKQAGKEVIKETFVGILKLIKSIKPYSAKIGDKRVWGFQFKKEF